MLTVLIVIFCWIAPMGILWLMYKFAQACRKTRWGWGYYCPPASKPPIVNQYFIILPDGSTKEVPSSYPMPAELPSNVIPLRKR